MDPVTTPGDSIPHREAILHLSQKNNLFRLSEHGNLRITNIKNGKSKTVPGPEGNWQTLSDQVDDQLFWIGIANERNDNSVFYRVKYGTIDDSDL